MAGKYWRAVHRRAAKESAATLHLDSREQIVIKGGVALAALVALVFWGSADAARDEMIARAGIACIITFLFPLVYLWKLFSVPATIHSEQQNELARLSDELNAHNRDILRIFYDKDAVKPMLILGAGTTHRRCCLFVQNTSFDRWLHHVRLRIISVNTRGMPNIWAEAPFLPLNLLAVNTITERAEPQVDLAPRQKQLFQVGQQQIVADKGQDFGFLGGTTMTVHARPLVFDVAAMAAPHTAKLMRFIVAFDENNIAHLEEMAIAEKGQ